MCRGRVGALIRGGPSFQTAVHRSAVVIEHVRHWALQQSPVCVFGGQKQRAEVAAAEATLKQCLTTRRRTV